MKREMYYELCDNADISVIATSLAECMNLIEADQEDDNEEPSEGKYSDRQYTITPIWLTDEEYNNLPEADF